jgi:hypothetical protein
MLSRRSLLPGAATLAAITVARTTAWADDGAFVVPMRIGENRFWTSTFINRKGPYRLFLDTGSPSYALAPSVIAELGLRAGGAKRGTIRRTRSYSAAFCAIETWNFSRRRLVLTSRVCFP